MRSKLNTETVICLVFPVSPWPQDKTKVINTGKNAHTNSMEVIIRQSFKSLWHWLRQFQHSGFGQRLAALMLTAQTHISSRSHVQRQPSQQTKMNWPFSGTAWEPPLTAGCRWRMFVARCCTRSHNSAVPPPVRQDLCTQTGHWHQHPLNTVTNRYNSTTCLRGRCDLREQIWVNCSKMLIKVKAGVPDSYLVMSYIKVIKTSLNG